MNDYECLSPSYYTVIFLCVPWANGLEKFSERSHESRREEAKFGVKREEMGRKVENGET